MNGSLRVVFAAILALAAGGMRAELVWDQKELEVAAEHGDPDARGTFKVTKRGDKPGRILAVQPSCGCTEAKTGRDVLAPNESTELSAKIALKGREGEVGVSIAVTTDERSGPTHVLAVKVVISELVQITPRFVFWQ